jgi:hypothetical protein
MTKTNGNGKMIGRVALGLVAGGLLAILTWMANGVLASEKHIERDGAEAANTAKHLDEIKASLSEVQSELTEIRLILARQRLDNTSFSKP